MNFAKAISQTTWRALARASQIDAIHTASARSVACQR